MKEQKVILITGASSGLGKAAASLLALKGHHVFGTSRKPANSSESAYEILALDVRSDISVAACVKDVMKREERIDVLINNAGYELAGAVEETRIEEARLQFETNFFGAVRMIKEILPIMRRQRCGHIINISSLAGLIGVPVHGFYSASKHALEGYSESLRYEVSDFNIRISLVEPGFMKTNFGKSAQSVAEKIEGYSRLRLCVQSFAETAVAWGDDPAIAANTILSIIENEKPKLRYRAGKEAKRVSRLKALLPWQMFEAGTRRRLKLDRVVDLPAHFRENSASS